MPRTRRSTLLLLAALLAAVLFSAGCSRASGPIVDSRERLGTVVTITAYPERSADPSATAEAIETAYRDLNKAGVALNAYLDPDWLENRFAYGYDPDPSRGTTSIHQFNQQPFMWRILPPEAERVLERVSLLGVEEQFSPALFEVVAAYDFGGDGTVPDENLLSVLLQAAETFETRKAVGGLEATFQSLGTASADDSDSTLIPAGLDIGGAAKGYALDQAIRVLKGDPSVTAALITAGSTTVTFGEKPDGEPWRVGVEDPRNPDATIATIEATGDVTVSTSGDYQRFFEVDGVRYHHILDPATGLPARGLRSLTVVGADTGVDSDILSTALFVMGHDAANAYAEEHGLGLVLVDDEGRVRVAPGPAERSWEIMAGEDPE